MVDAIVCSGTCIITIQVTMSETHPLNPRVFKLIKASLPKRFRKRRRWCHVFITDEEEKAKRLQTKSYQGLENIGFFISIYSSVLNVQALG